jgi:hypothetical protein
LADDAELALTWQHLAPSLAPWILASGCWNFLSLEFFHEIDI